MFSILNKIKRYWFNNGLLLLVLLSLAFLGIYWVICCINKSNGSYTSFDSFKFPLLRHTPKKNKKKPPTESKGEIACKNYLQNRFNKPFPKSRPNFMFNSVTGENLELDMFNKELLLACEYHGKQHYEYNSFMHKGSRDKFHTQKYRDRMKKDICKKLGIKLVEVPYTIQINDIPQYLELKLQKLGF